MEENKKKIFIYLTEEYLDNLEKKVIQYIDLGYEPVGCVSHWIGKTINKHEWDSERQNYFVQAMRLKEVPKEKKEVL